MHIEIDLSGRLEVTQVPTVLALSNGIKASLLVPSSVKRACLTKLASRKYERVRLYVLLYATCVFLLIKPYIKPGVLITIDEEFIGYEGLIKRHILSLLNAHSGVLDANQIRFSRIGKHSGAHFKAIDTFRKKLKPDRVIKFEEILKEF